MIWKLLKKDLLLVKKIVYLILVLSLIFPQFIAVGLEEMKPIPGFIPLFFSSMIFGMMFIAAILQHDERFPKGKGLLLTAGYTRSLQSFNKFLDAIVFFLFNFVIEMIEISLSNSFSSIKPTEALAVFTIYILFMTLFILLTSKFGISAGMIVYVVVILAISLGPTFLSRYHIQVDLSMFTRLSELNRCLLLSGISFVILLLGMKTNQCIYNKKEF